MVGFGEYRPLQPTKPNENLEKSINAGRNFNGNTSTMASRIIIVAVQQDHVK